MALDGRHTPALYSRFLSSLLAKHNYKPPLSGPDPPLNEISFHHQYNDGHQLTPPQVYSWPDIIYAENVDPTNEFNGGSMQRDDYQYGDTDMDFSLSHFVRSVTAGFPAPGTSDDMVDTLNWEFQSTATSGSLDCPNMWSS